MPSPEVLAAVRHDFGFDQPLYVQYLLMMKRLFVTGDLTSFVNRGQKVVPSILRGRSGHAVAVSRGRDPLGRRYRSPSASIGGR